MSKRLATVVLALGVAQSPIASALGLGELSLDSYLNEPLRATVDLLNTEGLNEDQIRIRLATSEDFDRMGVERAYFLTGIKFTVQVGANGDAQIMLSSQDPVLEPFLDFIIEARWPNGRLLREYTVLVDPPAFSAVTPKISAREEVGLTPVQPEKKPQTESVGTGTRVQMPREGASVTDPSDRDFARGTSPQAEGGNSYLVRRNDTLWRIASRVRPDGTSVQQTMLEIQRLNPDAFIGGNINQIKAGYVIYLPTASEFGSEDAAAVLAEVRDQNQRWRSDAGSSGPALRISAADDAGSSAGEGSGSSARSASTGAASAGSGDDSERVEALEEQLATLQDLVSLKDRQIAALQNALAEEQAGTEADAEGEVVDLEGVELNELESPEMEDALGDGTSAIDADSTEGALADTASTEDGSADLDADAAALIDEGDATAGAMGIDEPDEALEDDVAPETAATPAATPSTTTPEPQAKPARMTERPAQVESGANWLDYLFYAAGGLILALLAFFGLRWWRNRDDEPANDFDAFADVRLDDDSIELEEEEPAPATTAAADADEITAEAERVSDVSKDLDGETGDALAEADIYIAYGRYPQAVELLQKAIDQDPTNSAYRLKLLELYVDMNDREAAQQQFADLRAIADAGALEKGRALIESAPGGSNWLASLPESNLSGGMATAPVEQSLLADEEPLDLDLDDDIELPDLELDQITSQAGVADLTADTGEELEQDFGQLEIEGPGDIDDLDLSRDFTAEAITADADDEGSADDDEDLVIAETSDEADTKLDLARAYLDMGDEDGARQILEEVVAEAADSRAGQEAQGLLNQIG